MAKTLVGALRVTLGLDSAEFAAGAARVQALSAQMAKRMAVIGTAVSVVGAGLATAIRGAINTADDMGEMAQKLGVPVESLTALQHAAKILGVEFGELQGGLLRLSRGMADAPEKFDALGVAVRDANGQLRPTADVLRDVADKFKAMPDGAEKTALAMDLFGKSGAALIPMLNAGSAGITGLMEEAKALGLVISEETAESAGKFNENLDKLTGAAAGLAAIVAAQLAPVLERLSGFLVEMAQSFQNLSPGTQEFIAWAAGLTIIMGPLLLAMSVLIPIIGALLSPLTLVAAAIAGIVYAFLNWQEIVASVSGWISGLIDGALTQLGQALGIPPEQMDVFKQAAWDAIESIKQSFLTLPETIVGVFETIKEGIAGAWEFIKSTIGGAIDYVIGKWNEFIGLLSGAVETAKAAGKAISDALSTGRSEMNDGTGYGGMGGAMDEFGGGMFNPASYSTGQSMTDGIITGAMDQMSARSGELAAVMGVGLQAMRDAAQIASPSKVTEGYGRNLAEGIAKGITGAQDLVGQAAKGLTETATGAMKGIGDLGGRIADMFANAATNVLTGVESLQEAVGKLLQQLASMLINSAMKQLFGGLFGGLGGGGGLGIPGYATGTLSAARGLAMVGEQGPELVAMRGGERVYDARQTDRMLDGPGGGGQGTPITNQVYIDGKMVLEQIDTPEGRDIIARVNRRMGR